MPDQIPLATLRERGAAALNSPSPSEESESGAAFEPPRNQSPLGAQRVSALDHNDNGSRESLPHSSMEPEQANTSFRGTTSEEIEATTPRNPIRRLGKAVKSKMSSDLTAGILALSGLICAVLVGVWGILLARQQLDLGKWSFCKSYSNDTQVLQSSTCQRYAAKQSLDDLGRRDGRDERSITNVTSPILVLDAVPSWLIPPTVEKVSCNVVCWNLAPPAAIQERIETEARLAGVTKLSRHMLVFAGIGLPIVLLLHAYRIYRRRNGHLATQLLANHSVKETMLRDLSISKDTLLRSLSWICFSVFFLGILTLGTAPDFRGIIDALLTLLNLGLSQILIVVILSLIGVADFHDLLHVVVSQYIFKASIFPKSWIMPAILIIVFLVTRSMNSIASVIFLLHFLNFFFRVRQFLGDVVRHEELLEDRKRCEVHNIVID